MDLGEDLTAAAVREVYEETGVTAEFQSLIGFRHQHKGTFGRSEMYFICLFNANSTNINMDLTEVQACRWMPLRQYIDTITSPINGFAARIVEEQLLLQSTTQREEKELISGTPAPTTPILVASARAAQATEQAHHAVDPMLASSPSTRLGDPSLLGAVPGLTVSTLPSVVYPGRTFQFYHTPTAVPLPQGRYPGNTGV